MSDWKNVQYKDGKMRTSSGGGGGGSSTFAGLDDVNFSNLENGQVAKYNSTTQKWENANESGGGGGITEESLWTASSQSTGNFTLSKSIDNFDFIAIWYGDWNERTQWRNYIMYSVNSLNANHTAGLKISVIGYSTRYNIIDISGTTLSIITNSSQAILEVRGIKYS